LRTLASDTVSPAASSMSAAAMPSTNWGRVGEHEVLELL
jgi:hypothetical protein